VLVEKPITQSLDEMIELEKIHKDISKNKKIIIREAIYTCLLDSYKFIRDLFILSRGKALDRKNNYHEEITPEIVLNYLGKIKLVEINMGINPNNINENIKSKNLGGGAFEALGKLLKLLLGSYSLVLVLAIAGRSNILTLLNPPDDDIIVNTIKYEGENAVDKITNVNLSVPIGHNIIPIQCLHTFEKNDKFCRIIGERGELVFKNPHSPDEFILKENEKIIKKFNFSINPNNGDKDLKRPILGIEVQKFQELIENENEDSFISIKDSILLQRLMDKIRKQINESQ
jgi:predicted dehydrogenase